MIQFGSTGIVAGYIKQLLASFQLPKAQIYTAEHERYFDKHGKESPYLLETTFPGQTVKSGSEQLLSNNGHLINRHCYVPYLKDGRVQFLLGGYYLDNNKYVQGTWQSAPLDINNVRGGPWQTYSRGDKIPNLTRTLELKNNIYDSYTHEYLGDYLRFIRDYDGINLMSMYNCFSNRRPYRLKYKDDFISLDTSDSNYKIYVLPVKLFQEYTIAIDSAYPVELCCGIHTKLNNFTGVDTKNDEVIEQELSKLTYHKYASMRFNDPVLYTKLKDLAVTPMGTVVTAAEQEVHEERRKLLAQLGNQTHELKLYIKLHKNAETSIVVLEGNYLGWNDAAVMQTQTGSKTKLVVAANHTTLTSSAIFADFEPTYISPVSLLRLNTHSHTPFAPRLLEYLLDQCVTGGANEVRENVLMAQYSAGLRYTGNVNSYYALCPPRVMKGQKTPADPTEYWIFNGKMTDIPVGTDRLPKYKPVKLEDNSIAWKIYGTDPVTGIEIESEPELPIKVKITPDSLKYDLLNGVWTPALRKLFYGYMSNRPDFASYADILGYVDKDVEKSFVATTYNGDKPISKSMIDFNVWEDIKE